MSPDPEGILSIVSSGAPLDAVEDAAFDAFVARVSARFQANVQEGVVPVFTTDAGENAPGLWEVYLSHFPPEMRQRYDCHACKQFITRFGGLVTIDERGGTKSALWDEEDTPTLFLPSVRAMAAQVQNATVTGVFRSSHAIWGRPETGAWRHFAVTPPASMVFQRATQTAEQAIAEKREDFKTVQSALADFTTPLLEQALKLLETESLYRSEKVLGQAQWLANLHAARAKVKGKGKDNAVRNVTWLAVATAPAGFCHPRSSMIGTLLDDLAAGRDFGEVSRRFAAKMHPLQYQRPQAAPTAGAIAAAEKIIAQLGAAGSLARRYCRVEEVEAIWTPADKPRTTGKEAAGSGVFAHLVPKTAKGTAAPGVQIPPVVMTWEKFARTVLPTAEQIEFYARNALSNFAVLVTAVNADTPPILQWDREDARNPVSLYVWTGGSKPSQFGLETAAFHKIVAVTYGPSMWGVKPDAYPHQGKNVLFLIEGATESRSPGLALFPEVLKAEFHGVRSVIEAYSRGGKLEGFGKPSAIGICLSSGGKWDALFRVTTRGRSVEYTLDRWD